MTATILGWVLATIAWAGFAGVQSARIEKLNKENRLLKSENTRLEKATRKEPTTVEAVAALVAKCKRNDGETCETCVEPELKMFCIHCIKGDNAFGLHEVPAAIACAGFDGYPKKTALEIDKQVGKYLGRES